MDDYLTQENEDEIRALLVGRKVEAILGGGESKLILDNGTVLDVKGNEGCGGCGNGWYDIEELNGVDNVITSVDFEWVEQGYDDIFSIFVYAEMAATRLLSVKGFDNGYYGQGYRIYVRKGSND